MSSCGLTITLDRSEEVDFTIALLKDATTFITLAQNGAPAMNIRGYLAVFDTPVWLLGLVVVLCLGLGFGFCRQCNEQQFHGDHDSENFGCINGLAVVLMAMAQKCYDIEVKKNSSRILLNTTYIFAFLAFSCFTADLTSQLTSVPPPKDVKSFQDVDERELNLIIWGGGSSESTLKRSPANSYTRKVYERSIKNPKNIIRSVEELARRIRADPTGSIAYGAASIAVLDPSYRALGQIDEVVGEHLGIGLQKDSEFIQLFNYHFQKMKDGGIIRLISKRWNNENVDPPDSQQSPSRIATSLGYDHVSFPFIPIALGIVVAVTVVATEKASYTMNNLQSSRRNE